MCRPIKLISGLNNNVTFMPKRKKPIITKPAIKKELSEFVNNLTTGQFSKIQKFFETMPRLSKEIIWTCKGCNKTHTRKIEGLANFFS